MRVRMRRRGCPSPRATTAQRLLVDRWRSEGAVPGVIPQRSHRGRFGPSSRRPEGSGRCAARVIAQRSDRTARRRAQLSHDRRGTDGLALRVVVGRRPTRAGRRVRQLGRARAQCRSGDVRRSVAVRPRGRRQSVDRRWWVGPVATREGRDELRRSEPMASEVRPRRSVPRRCATRRRPGSGSSSVLVFGAPAGGKGPPRSGSAPRSPRALAAPSRVGADARAAPARSAARQP